MSSEIQNLKNPHTIVVFISPLRCFLDGCIFKYSVKKKHNFLPFTFHLNGILLRFLLILSHFRKKNTVFICGSIGARTVV